MKLRGLRLFGAKENRTPMLTPKALYTCMAYMHGLHRPAGLLLCTAALAELWRHSARNITNRLSHLGGLAARYSLAKSLLLLHFGPDARASKVLLSGFSSRWVRFLQSYFTLEASAVVCASGPVAG